MTQLTIDNLAPTALETSLRWQFNAFALRQEMGFPLTPMANEAVKWTGGRVADSQRGIEVARIAAALGRDLIYIGWRDTKAKAPAQVALAYRDELVIDWRDSLELWAADDTNPLLLIDRARSERYERGERNMLVRRTGLPSGDLARGCRLAKARVGRAAASMSGALAVGTCVVPVGGDVAEHVPAATDIAVRLS